MVAGSKTVTFIFNEGLVRISTGIISKMEKPSFIRFLLNIKEEKLILIPLTKKDQQCVKVNYDLKSEHNGVRIYSKLLAEKIYAIMNWNLNRAYRIESVVELEDKTFIVDLNDAIVA